MKSFSDLRRDFPILSTAARKGNPLVYFDNAATAQKPLAVIEAIDQFYRTSNANIHRGVHCLGEKATATYEGAREKVAKFLKAANASEIIFTRNATEAINLVAASWGRTFLKKGDVIVLTVAEHHANIVPWWMLSQELGLVIKVVPVDGLGVLDLAVYEQYLREGNVRLVAVGYASNVLGTIHDVKKITSLAHANGAAILIDAAQAAPHIPIDVVALDCDFLVFTGHKVFGPTGIGALYGKQSWLEKMPPYQGGGDMIEQVSFERITFRMPPARFEAGTPAIAEAAGLGAAIDYFGALDHADLEAHEQALLKCATAGLLDIPGVEIQGTAPHKVSLVSFTLEGVHPHDLASILDAHGVAIRAGHHCAQPLMRHLGKVATARASFAFYNTLDEVKVFLDAVKAAKKMMG